MSRYIAPPPMSPLSRLLAGILAAVALAGALFFGFFVLLLVLGVGLVAWLVIWVRIWWLTRKTGGKSTADTRRTDVIDAEYEVIERRDEE